MSDPLAEGTDHLASIKAARDAAADERLPEEIARTRAVEDHKGRRPTPGNAPPASPFDRPPPVKPFGRSRIAKGPKLAPESEERMDLIACAFTGAVPQDIALLAEPFYREIFAGGTAAGCKLTVGHRPRSSDDPGERPAYVSTTLAVFEEMRRLLPQLFGLDWDLRWQRLPGEATTNDKLFFNKARNRIGDLAAMAAEKKLGRKLSADEAVWLRDGNPLNCLRSNIELVLRSERARRVTAFGLPKADKTPEVRGELYQRVKQVQFHAGRDHEGLGRPINERGEAKHLQWVYGWLDDADKTEVCAIFITGARRHPGDNLMYVLVDADLGRALEAEEAALWDVVPFYQGISFVLSPAEPVPDEADVVQWTRDISISFARLVWDIAFPHDLWQRGDRINFSDGNPLNCHPDNLLKNDRPPLPAPID